MHRTTGRLRSHFARLPGSVQVAARKSFELLKSNPSHPSLHFKKAGKLGSVRAGLNHRALAIKDGGDVIWVWIGTHDEYTRLVKQQG
jgi:hypothetical protein